eukprot:maker-scaffold1624_size33151-snap-gene-0.7 protein:Tk07386 transcript:maker-scaffold1624_size33151-snap-gene-0.7-mRNA-1 annotation:"---NA---"
MNSRSAHSIPTTVALSIAPRSAIGARPKPMLHPRPMKPPIKVATSQPLSLMPEPPTTPSPETVISELQYSSSSEASTSATTSSGNTVRLLARDLDDEMDSTLDLVDRSYDTDSPLSSLSSATPAPPALSASIQGGYGSQLGQLSSSQLDRTVPMPSLAQPAPEMPTTKPDPTSLTRMPRILSVTMAPSSPSGLGTGLGSSGPSACPSATSLTSAHDPLEKPMAKGDARGSVGEDEGQPSRDPKSDNPTQ